MKSSRSSFGRSLRSSLGSTTTTASTDSGVTQFQYLWSKFARKSSTFQEPIEDYDVRGEKRSIGSRCCQYLHLHELLHKLKIAFQHAYIVVSMLLTFGIILAVGLIIVFQYADREKGEDLDYQMERATEKTAYALDDALYNASLPLFAMEEMGRQIDEFNSLPQQTADAPMIYSNSSGSWENIVIHRNVSDICYPSEETETISYIDLYQGLAKQIAGDVNLTTLTNINLVPSGVICLLYVVGDYLPQNELKNNPAVGLDTLHTPPSDYYFQKSLDLNYPVLHGPLTLIQDDVESVKLIAIDPVFLGANASDLWGFSEVILDWNTLESEIGIDQYFSDHNMEYRLTRPATASDDEIFLYKNQDKVIIMQSDHGHTLSNDNSRDVPIKAFKSGWVLTIAYPFTYAQPSWVYWVPVLVFLIAIFSCITVMIILVNKLEHEKLLYRMMPRNIVNRLHNGEENILEKYDQATLCQLDIVSFTTISGQMHAADVMNMLKILYTEFDKVASKHEVFNVETIGDAYIVIGGGPDNCNGVEGAKKVALFALDVIKTIQNLPLFQNRWQVSVRAGLASGVVIAGVVGSTLVPKYTLFADTVSLVEATESGSAANKVLCSPVTFNLLKQCATHDFELELKQDGKKIICNGRPVKQTFWVNGGTLRKDFDKDRASVISKPTDIVLNNKDNSKNGGSRRASQESKRSSMASALSDDGDFAAYLEDLEECLSVDEYVESIDENGEFLNDVEKINEENNGVEVESSDKAHKIEFLPQSKIEDNISINHKLTEENNGSSVQANGPTFVENTTTEDNIVTQKPPVANGILKRASYGQTILTNVDVSDDYNNDESSAGSKSTNAIVDYWSRVAKNADVWQDGHDVNESMKTSKIPKKQILINNWKRTLFVAKKFKKIPLIALLTFAAICAVGLTTVLIFARQHSNEMLELARDKARSTDRYLENEIRKSLLPLFAMSQFVKHLDTFDPLPELIDPTPFREDDPTFRNVTGICDNKTFTEPFYEMASSIKQRAELQKILVNIQLAPVGVLCLTYPLNNTEDFEDGMYLDTSGAIGVDLLNHPTRSEVSKAAVRENRYTIQGPIPLVQGSASVVDEAVIARYPISVDYHNHTMEGVTYPFWGFSIALMDWDKLKEKIGIYEYFSKDGLEFKMTRTDVVENTTTGEKYMKESVIATSERSSTLNDENSIKVPLNATDNGWVLRVGYEKGVDPTYKIWGSILVVLVALIISTLIFMLLITTKEHQLLLYRMIPEEVIKRLQSGETVVDRHELATVYFSEILGYAHMSEQMKPKDFLIMMNQIYEEFDRLTIKHKVLKVEAIGARYIVFAAGRKKLRIDNKEDAVRVALFALDAMNFVQNYRYKNMRFYIRSGMASGPIVSGIIGAARPKYTVFGDTVNFSSRMETTAKSMKIQCNESTYNLLQENRSNWSFGLDKRLTDGKHGIKVKGKGLQYTWWVKGATQCVSTSTEDENSIIEKGGDAYTKKVAIAEGCTKEYAEQSSNVL